MSSGEWLLLLSFFCLKSLVTADDLANQTVDRIVLDDRSEFVQKQYKKSLPDNETDFSVFRELEWIFDNRDDSACYHVFFDNSSSMIEERSVQAKETGEALRLGWERSKNVSAGMYCPRQDANCEWNFPGVVGRYFKSLDAYLTSVYDGLLTAIDEASEKLAAGKAPEKYKDVCTRTNLTVLTCELLRIERVCGENCGGKTKFVIPPKCSPWKDRDNGYREWPVEPARSKDSWNLGCWWPKIPGQFDNLRRLDKFLRVLSSRILHLVTAQGFCGGAREDNVINEDLVTSIKDAGAETQDRSKADYFATGGPKVIDEVANGFEGLVWPDSEEETKKYKELSMKIEEAFVGDYGDMDRRDYLIFYPCKDEAFAMVRDVSTGKALILVRRPDVNVIARKDEYTSCEANNQDYRFKNNKDAILSAYKGGCFKAIMAIECAYKFSWLELGWKYFPAWHYDFTFESVKVRFDSPLSPMCADIVFIK